MRNGIQPCRVAARENILYTEMLRLVALREDEDPSAMRLMRQANQNSRQIMPHVRAKKERKVKCARCRKPELAVFGKESNLCAFCWIYNPKK